MQQIMSREEIEAQFKSEWVLIGDPQTTENLEVIKGIVLWHSPNRDELYQKAIELQPKHSAILYTGETPKGMAIIL